MGFAKNVIWGVKVGDFHGSFKSVGINIIEKKVLWCFAFKVWYKMPEKIKNCVTFQTNCLTKSTWNSSILQKEFKLQIL